MEGIRGRDKATVVNMGRATPMLCLAEAEARAEAERRREHVPVRRKDERVQTQVLGMGAMSRSQVG